MAQSDMLVWIDLETTGLDPVKDQIIEVAAIVTDGALNERRRFQRLVRPSVDFFALDPEVQAIHKANGLCDELWDEDGWPKRVAPTRSVVARELFEFIAYATDVDILAAYCKMAHATPLAAQAAGSTIGFDREFLRHHMPEAHGLLHYRSFDVSSLNELARRQWPAVYAGRPRAGNKAHRAMADIEQSLEVARYYAQALGPSA